MATIDQQFVEYIVKTLVNNPEKVVVDREIDERGVLLSLSVDPEDVGRVIGKRGATAQSIRTLLRVLGTKNGARYNLKVVNTDGVGVEGNDRGYRGESRADAEAVGELRADEENHEAPLDGGDSERELAEKTRAELADLDDLDIQSERITAEQ